MRIRRAVVYARCHKRWPRMKSPVTFTEKLNWRILNDRRELIAVACDKLRTKELAEGVVDCPATIWSGEDVAELASVTLPDRWVLKPNHTSGKVYLGEGPAKLDELRRTTAGWLDRGQEHVLGEWGYSRARRTLLVEERLGDGVHVPDDYKCFVFGGSLAYIQVDSARFSGHRRRLYSPRWEPLEAKVKFLPLGPVQPKPQGLEDMVAIAERLGAPYDFIRVDLYNVEGRIYLGELTPYHGSGLEAYEPAEFDTDLGHRWQLPERSTV